MGWRPCVKLPNDGNTSCCICRVPCNLQSLLWVLCENINVHVSQSEILESLLPFETVDDSLKRKRVHCKDIISWFRAECNNPFLTQLLKWAIFAPNSTLCPSALFTSLIKTTLSSLFIFESEESWFKKKHFVRCFKYICIKNLISKDTDFYWKRKFCLKT